MQNQSNDKELIKNDNYDYVNHPNHYENGRRYEPIKVLNDWQLSGNLFNCVKYISRLNRKDINTRELNKSLFYLLFECGMQGISKEEALTTLNTVYTKIDEFKKGC